MTDHGSGHGLPGDRANVGMPAHGAHDGHAMAHDKHAGHSVAMFRDKFWLSLALTIPVLLWSRDPQAWLGYAAPQFRGSDWIPAILGTAVFLYGGLVFLRGAAGELRGRQPGMMTLISLAIVVAFGTSWSGTLGLFEVEIWWELATLITIMLLGHWLEMRSIAQARGALAALAELLPDTAERVTPDGTETVPLAQLAVGDVVLVRPGARIPADGVVDEGSADVDESMITGESQAVGKEPGDRVVAGTVAAGGSLRVRVAAVGEGTALSGIMRMVVAAQASASRAQALADRAAAILFYVALAAGALTLGFWWLRGDHVGALVRTATVLVIACPHALGLAIPLVIAISTSLGARNGLLVKSRMALERARELDVVIFDKTGTLTMGRPALAAVSAAVGMDEGGVLRLAAAVEADSEHPLARSIVAAAAGREVEVPAATAFEALAGRGARATVEGRRVAVGGPRLLADLGLPAGPASEAWAREGRTVLHVVADGMVVGTLAIEDEIRPESAQAIERLHAMGLTVAMITGGCAGSRGLRRAPARDRRGRGASPPAGQGGRRAPVPAGRPEGRHGRRRRERRTGSRNRRRGDRDRRRDGRRRRIGGDRAGPQRPAGRGRGDRAVPGHLREDDPEPRLGDRVQPRGDPGRGGGPRAVGHRPADGRRSDRDEPLDDHRGRKRPAPSATEAAQRALSRPPGVPADVRRDHREDADPGRRSSAA
jgi:Cu2+-exporting ATPase